MQKLLLVRHGQASAGSHDYDQLSDIGMRQAELLGKFWSQHNIQIDHAFAGNLKRQQQTAQLSLSAIKPSAPVTELLGLNEYEHKVVDHLFGEGFESAGSEPLSYNNYLAIMQRWRDATEQQLNGEQSWQQFEKAGWQSLLAAIKQAPNAKTIALFSSGGVIACILKQLLAWDFNRTIDSIWQIRNASVTTLGVHAGGIILIDYNTVSHLDAQFDQSLITLI